MSITFHVAEGNDDFNAFTSLWPEKFGAIERNFSSQHLIANAFRSGSAILARRSTDQTPVAATVLDFTTYTNALFVPFILINESASNRAAIHRRTLDLILRVVEASKVDRILFVSDDSKDVRGAVVDFNEAASKAGVPTALKIVGQAENLYGDGRNVIFHQLFITSRERPDLTSRVTRASATDELDDVSDTDTQSTVARMASPASAAGIGSRVLSDRLFTTALCSSSKERGKDGKDTGKDTGKDKEAKEGIDWPVAAPTEKLNAEGIGVFELYSRVGIKRFNRYSQEKFNPLV